MMHVNTVRSLLSTLCQLSHQCLAATFSSVGLTSNNCFSVVRILCIIINNLHKVASLWEEVVSHFLEFADCSSLQLQTVARDTLDKSITAVLGSDQFLGNILSKSDDASNNQVDGSRLKFLECVVIFPLKDLIYSSESMEIRAGSWKILLHVLEKHGEKLHYNWPSILEVFRTIARASEKDLVTIRIQSLRVIMNDGLSSIPADCLHEAIDLVMKGLKNQTEVKFEPDQRIGGKGVEPVSDSHNRVVDRDELLFSVFSLLQNLGTDGRPVVRNTAVRMLYHILGSHEQKFSRSEWENCLWNYVFKPSHGVVSTVGVIPMAQSFDAVGWVARYPLMLNQVGKILLQLKDDNFGSPSQVIIADDCFKLINNCDGVKEVLIQAVEKLYGSQIVLVYEYMYHGGTDFGRSTEGPFITTSYDYDAPFDEYCLIRQLKYGHLKELHRAIIKYEEAWISADPTLISLENFQQARVFTSKSGECAASLSNYVCDPGGGQSCAKKSADSQLSRQITTLRTRLLLRGRHCKDRTFKIVAFHE